MNSKVIVTALMCLAQTLLVQSDCNCGLGAGRSVCSQVTDGQPQVVRARPLPAIEIPNPRPRLVLTQMPGFVNPLRPVGDLCSCSQTIVKPAVLPRPACSGGCNGGMPRFGRPGGPINRMLLRNAQSLNGNSASSTSLGDSGAFGSTGNLGINGYSQQGGNQVASLDPSSSSNSQNFQNMQTSFSSGGGATGGVGGNMGSLDPSIVGASATNAFSTNLDSSNAFSCISSKGSNPLTDVPADPISQTLATANANAMNYVSQRVLAYGFSRLPVDGSRQITKPVFAEENLQRLNGPILELKNTMPGMSVDDQAIADAQNNDDEDDQLTTSGLNIRTLTMGEIGYGVEKPNKPQYMNVLGISGSGTVLSGLNFNSGSTSVDPGTGAGLVLNSGLGVNRGIISNSMASSMQSNSGIGSGSGLAASGFAANGSPSCNDGFVNGQLIINDSPVNNGPQGLYGGNVGGGQGATYSTYSSSTGQSYSSDSSQSGMFVSNVGGGSGGCL